MTLTPKNKYRPQFLERWQKVPSYSGPDWSEWYVVCELFADSDAKSRSNYAAAERQLREQTPPRFELLIMNAKFTDYWSKWRRKLMVHESCAPALRVGDEVAEHLLRHEVLDPPGHEKVLRRELLDTWAKMARPARITACAEAGVSIFVARRKTFPLNEPDIRVALTDVIGRI